MSCRRVNHRVSPPLPSAVFLHVLMEFGWKSFVWNVETSDQVSLWTNEFFDKRYYFIMMKNINACANVYNPFQSYENQHFIGWKWIRTKSADLNLSETCCHSQPSFLGLQRHRRLHSLTSLGNRWRDGPWMTPQCCESCSAQRATALSFTGAAANYTHNHSLAFSLKSKLQVKLHFRLK